MSLNAQKPQKAFTVAQDIQCHSRVPTASKWHTWKNPREITGKLALSIQEEATKGLCVKIEVKTTLKVVASPPYLGGSVSVPVPTGRNALV